MKTIRTMFIGQMTDINIGGVIVKIPIRCRVHNDGIKERITANTLEEAKSRYDKEFDVETSIDNWSEADYKERLLVMDDEWESEINLRGWCQWEGNFSWSHKRRLMPLWEHLQRHSGEVEVAFSNEI